MGRWQKQAHATAAAVMEAKNEVLERKRELDHTKLKMDSLIEKLYVGRESAGALQVSNETSTSPRLVFGLQSGCSS